MHNKKMRKCSNIALVKFISVAGMCNPFANHSHKRDPNLDTSKTLTNAYAEHYYVPAGFSSLSVVVVGSDLYYKHYYIFYPSKHKSPVHTASMRMALEVL
jgi:hypothetical protein